MKICEIESCNGQKINTSEILFFDKKDKTIKEMSGNPVAELSYNLTDLSNKFKQIDGLLQDLHHESINDDIMKELSAMKDLINHQTIDISKSKALKEKVDLVVDTINDKVTKIVDSLKVTYDKKLDEFKDDIERTINENIDEIHKIINTFKIYLNDFKTEFESTFHEYSGELTDKKNELVNDLDAEKDVLSNAIKQQGNELQKNIDVANEKVSTLITKADFNKDFKTLKDSINSVMGTYEDKIKNEDKFLSDMVDTKIKNQIVDKLAKVNGHSLLGDDIKLPRSRYVDLYDRGNISSADAAVAIVKSMYNEIPDDIFIIRWRNYYWVRSGYHSYKRIRTYIRRYVVTDSSWVSF